MKYNKIANAGYRVLELLKELAKNPLSPEELLAYLEDTTDGSFRKELVLKYINTLRLLNIHVVKVNNKYCLQKSLERADFEKDEISALLFLRNYINKINYEALKDDVVQALQVVEQNFSEKTQHQINSKRVRTYRLDKPLEIRDSNIRKFEKYCEDNQKIDIIYLDETDKEVFYKLAPIKVVYRKGKAMLIAYDAAEGYYKEFLVENILSSKQTPQKQPKSYPSTILFKLKNRLAKSYVVKEGEVVLEYADDYILISNKMEDKEQLVRRLLRYYNQCEIVYPKSLRKKFIEIITQMEKLYE